MGLGLAAWKGGLNLAAIFQAISGLEFLLLILVFAWTVIAILLAEKMKQDVDAMELIWVQAKLNPKFESLFEKPSNLPGSQAPT